MQLGMIGLGRMGGSMVRRLVKNGHECVGRCHRSSLFAGDGFTACPAARHLADGAGGGRSEVWRRGSVIGSWLLDLTASALLEDPELAQYGGRVSDSGEGRRTIQAAIDEGVPAPVLSAALYSRFTSRGNAESSNRILSAMRHEFGGHVEKPAP